LETSGGREKPGGVSDDTGDGGGRSGERELREIEKRDEEESWHRFKFSNSQANRTGMIGATGGHASQAGWITSRATADGMTQLRQPDWRDAQLGPT
jgi:hypothetical protein